MTLDINQLTPIPEIDIKRNKQLRFDLFNNRPPLSVSTFHQPDNSSVDENFSNGIEKNIGNVRIEDYEGSGGTLTLTNLDSMNSTRNML